MFHQPFPTRTWGAGNNVATDLVGMSIREERHNLPVSRRKGEWLAFRGKDAGAIFTQVLITGDITDQRLSDEGGSVAICEVCGKHKVVQNGCDHGQLDVDEINARMLEYILEKPVH
ncbi:hypothetical protein KDX31_17315 [Amphritea atlantica]|uniref:Uncharacterized protein n=1 Tax=Amphritea atlantica TaxID=355243 RepID=A0ABY5GUU9_9GAMM|nr:hypothetical protein KDX31_17315 [Amphritea atlantica]